MQRWCKGRLTADTAQGFHHGFFLLYQSGGNARGDTGHPRVDPLHRLNTLASDQFASVPPEVRRTPTFVKSVIGQAIWNTCTYLASHHATFQWAALMTNSSLVCCQNAVLSSSKRNTGKSSRDFFVRPLSAFIYSRSDASYATWAPDVQKGLTAAASILTFALNSVQ